MHQVEVRPVVVKDVPFFIYLTKFTPGRLLIQSGFIWYYWYVRNGKQQLKPNTLWFLRLVFGRPPCWRQWNCIKLTAPSALKVLLLLTRSMNGSLGKLLDAVTTKSKLLLVCRNSWCRTIISSVLCCIEETCAISACQVVYILRRVWELVEHWNWRAFEHTLVFQISFLVGMIVILTLIWVVVLWRLLGYRLHGLEIILTEQLIPAALPLEEQAKHWVLAFSTFDENEKKALQFILLQKQRQDFGSIWVNITYDHKIKICSFLVVLASGPHLGLSTWLVLILLVFILHYPCSKVNDELLSWSIYEAIIICHMVYMISVVHTCHICSSSLIHLLWYFSN